MDTSSEAKDDFAEKDFIIGRNLIIATISLLIVVGFILYVFVWEDALLVNFLLLIILFMFAVIAHQHKRVFGRPRLEMTLIIILIIAVAFAANMYLYEKGRYTKLLA